MKKRTATLAVRKRRDKFILSLLYVCLGFYLGSTPLTAQTGADLELSRAYTRMAYENPALSVNESISLLQAALEFNPGNNDARALMIRLQIRHDEEKRYTSYRRGLEEALAGGTFVLIDSHTVRMDLASLYERLMEYDSLSMLLDQIPTGRRNAEWFRLRSVAYYRLGEEAEARAIARRGGRLFPENEAFSLWRIRIDPEYRDFLMQNLKNPAQPRPNETRLAALIEFSESDEERLELIDLFTVLDYQAAEGRLWRYRLTEDVEETPPFPELLRSWQLVDGAYEFYTAKDEIEAWNSFLAEYDREFPGDFNRDGFPERYFHLVNGSLREYREDLDQDGVFEQRVLFAAMTKSSDRPDPIELSIRDTDGTTYIRFALYPQVSEIKLDRGLRTTRYLFAPDAYSLPVVEVQIMPPIVNLPRFLSLDQAELTRRSYSRQVEEPQRTIVASGDSSRADLAGETVIEAYRTNGREILLRDLNGDGRSEIREEYRNGILELLLLDQDENGIFEYRYDMLNEREEWDFDQDGRTDYQAPRTQE